LEATDDEVVALLAAAVRPETRLAIVDHIAAGTAKLFPVARIAAAMRAAEVPLLVDAAHVPGMIDADVDGVGADFWVGNFHKWGLAPRPTALLHVAPQWRDRMLPLVVSHADGDGYPFSIEHQGTRDLTPWLAAPAGLDFLASLGIERVRSYAYAIAAHTQALVAAAIDASVPDPGPGVSMRVIPLPKPYAVKPMRDLIADRLGVETNVLSWAGRTFLRVSGHIYVRGADAVRLADGLPGLLASA
jgi:isopenicillin-N epimerase